MNALNQQMMNMNDLIFQNQNADFTIPITFKLED